MSYTISDCPLCGGHDFFPVLKARDFHYQNPGVYTLVECAECALSFLDPMYGDTELSAFYPENYYAFSDRFSAKQISFTKRLLRKFLGVREFQTRDPQFPEPGRILDVGCGSGWFISEMREKGWQVAGVEPNRLAAEYGRAERGLDIFPGTLIEAAFPSRSFDYVRMNHSFEHMSDPNLILDEVHRILSPRGKLMIGVPNRASLNAKLFGPYWYHLALPLHAYSYSRKTLLRILNKHRFVCERVIFNADNTGLQGSLQFFLNRKTEPLQTEGRITASRIVRVFTIWAAHLQNLLKIADQIEITCVKQ